LKPGAAPGTDGRSTAAREADAVKLHYVQIHSFQGDKSTRAEVFTDQRKGRAAAGLDP